MISPLGVMNTGLEVGIYNKVSDRERLLRDYDTSLCSDMHREEESLEGLYVDLKSDRL